MKKIKFLILSFCLLIPLTLGGCGKAVINSEADEIKLYSWEYSGEQGLFSSLCFDEDNAILTIKNGSEHCEINGLCVFEENNFVIIDNNLKKEFLFNYTLSGKELTLEYNGDVISFLKNE